MFDSIGPWFDSYLIVVSALNLFQPLNVGHCHALNLAFQNCFVTLFNRRVLRSVVQQQVVRMPAEVAGQIIVGCDLRAWFVAGDIERKISGAGSDRVPSHASVKARVCLGQLINGQDGSTLSRFFNEVRSSIGDRDLVLVPSHFWIWLGKGFADL